MCGASSRNISCRRSGRNRASRARSGPAQASLCAETGYHSPMREPLGRPEHARTVSPEGERPMSDYRRDSKAMVFEDRADAGRHLAILLEEYRDRDAIVLALPRGGVVVGYEVAIALH